MKFSMVPGGSAGLRGQVPAAERAGFQTFLWRCADDFHRRFVSAAAGGVRRGTRIFQTHYSSPYFGARVMEGLEMEFVELEKVYRQKDDEFIRLLNAVRNNSVTDADIAVFNQRYDPSFGEDPPVILYFIDQHQ